MRTLMSQQEGGGAMSRYETIVLIMMGIPLAVSFGKFVVKRMLDFLDNRYKK